MPHPGSENHLGWVKRVIGWEQEPGCENTILIRCVFRSPTETSEITPGRRGEWPANEENEPEEENEISCGKKGVQKKVK